MALVDDLCLVILVLIIDLSCGDYYGGMVVALVFSVVVKCIFD